VGRWRLARGAQGTHGTQEHPRDDPTCTREGKGNWAVYEVQPAAPFSETDRITVIWDSRETTRGPASTAELRMGVDAVRPSAELAATHELATAVAKFRGSRLRI
jgi:hypothetical protein